MITVAKVEKMKSEGEATAQRLVQLRNQNEELVNQRDDFRNRVSLLMHRSQQREQVCCNLQYEISQLRTQLTGEVHCFLLYAYSVCGK